MLSVEQEVRRPSDVAYRRALGIVTVAALAYSIVPSVDDWMLVLLFAQSRELTTWSLLATACYLPLHVRHVWYAVHARRPPAAGWTLLAMAVIILGALPLAGQSWTRALSALAASTLIVLRPPWSWVLFGCVILGSVPTALMFGDRVADSYWHMSVVLGRSLILFVLVWLASALRRLQAARQVLAEGSLARERRRIDRELEATVVRALEAIVARGQRAAATVGSSHGEPSREVEALVGESRSALDRVRRIVRGYQSVPLSVELDTAVRLLAAAGVDTTLRMPRGELSDLQQQNLRAELRAATTRLLRTSSATAYVLTVTQTGQLRVNEAVERSAPRKDEVAAS